MQTTILSGAGLGPAIEALKEGQVVAFPTETVYGLGANGLDEAACRRIFEAKGRPSDNPLILHVLDWEAMADITSGEVPSYAAALASAFWPGPLTVVVPAAKTVPALVRAGLDTVAVRSPSHPVARALIAGLGAPIAAPSANISGRPSATTAEAVYEDMNGRIPYIIDGGSTPVGLESTVVDCTTSPVTLLRPGAISVEMVASVVGSVTMAEANGPVRAPGMKYRHYAPRAPLIWIPSTESAFVRDTVEKLEAQYGRLALIAPDSVPTENVELFQSLGPDAVTAANRLFGAVRALDQMNPGAIVVVWESKEGLGLAIANRLEKAAERQEMP